MPVSDEFQCNKCHGTDTFNNILKLHDKENETSLFSQKPILCANCHGSPALGKIGEGSSGVYLSEAIHGVHSSKVSSCYDCHPGKNSKCNRSLSHKGTDGNCATCHGSMDDVAESIEEENRIPWVNEPKCSTCHVGIPLVNIGDTLFRNAKGHGGLYCTTCHGAPHAMIPSSIESDNYQAIQYQNKAKTIGSCAACHEKSKGEEDEIDEFASTHGGSNPKIKISCNICHTSVSENKDKWPHAYQWKNR